MSELNNIKEETSNIKNSIPNKALICFLIIFTIVAVGVTAALIYLTNNKEAETSKAPENIQNNVEEIKDESNLASKLTDMYSENPIEIELYYYYDGVTKKESQYAEGENEDYLKEHEKKCSYIQINGLKDKTVQNKINKEIEETTKKLLDKCNSSYAILEGNYANVISISISSEEFAETGDYTGSQTLNYRLDTGEQIQFEDLFTNKAYIKTILTQSAYKQYIKDNHYDFLDLDDVDYSKVESYAYNIVNRYINGEKFLFAFSYNEIYLIFNNEYITINMEDFYNNIAIYKRYLTDKDIYENDVKAPKTFVFSTRMFDNCFYSKLEETGENLFTDVSLYNFSESEDKNTQNEIIKSMEIVLEKVKNMAIQNQDKAFVLCYQDNTIDGALAVGGFETNQTSAYLYVMNKQYYIEKGKEEVAKSNREYKDYGTAMSYSFDNAITYIYENGEFVLFQEENEE